MRQPVTRTMPTLALADWARPRESSGLPAPLDRERVTFWYSCRTALWQAVRALKLEEGSAVALPAFSCGSEIEPFLRAGLVPCFYRSLANLDPDPQSFEEAARGASAALVTHYFGFPVQTREVKAICERHTLALIEDCAHALYARNEHGWLGEGADAAVFSFTKSLAVPDGGALLLRGSAPSAVAAARPPRREVARRLRSLVMRDLRASPSTLVRGLAHLPAGIKKLTGIRPGGEDFSTADGIEQAMSFRADQEGTSMSASAMRLLRATDHARVRQLRRRRFEELVVAARQAGGLRPFFDSLPDGACPLFLPVEVRDPEGFRSQLKKHRLGARHFWAWYHPAVPWKAFPHEAHLKQALFGVPLHQSLRDEEVRRLAEFLIHYRVNPAA